MVILVLFMGGSYGGAIQKYSGLGGCYFPFGNGVQR